MSMICEFNAKFLKSISNNDKILNLLVLTRLRISKGNSQFFVKNRVEILSETRAANTQHDALGEVLLRLLRQAVPGHPRRPEAPPPGRAAPTRPRPLVRLHPPPRSAGNPPLFPFPVVASSALWLARFVEHRVCHSVRVRSVLSG